MKTLYYGVVVILLPLILYSQERLSFYEPRFVELDSAKSQDEVGVFENEAKLNSHPIARLPSNIYDKIDSLYVVPWYTFSLWVKPNLLLLGIVEGEGHGNGFVSDYFVYDFNSNELYPYEKWMKMNGRNIMDIPAEEVLWYKFSPRRTFLFCTSHAQSGILSQISILFVWNLANLGVRYINLQVPRAIKPIRDTLHDRSIEVFEDGFWLNDSTMVIKMHFEYSSEDCFAVLYELVFHSDDRTESKVLEITRTE